MSDDTALLAALTDEPVTTSDLYDRVGYMQLTALGLVPYAAFRRALAELCAGGVVESSVAADGSTLWRLASGAAPD
ncbi:MAG TPA: hypothetical protein VIK04_06140 [Solirubrobacteraceae bacterium]